MRAAYISDFTDTLEQERLWSSQIRELTQADCLIGIMSADYLQNGLPAAQTRRQRRKLGLSAGTDCVLEMSLYASLSSIGIYAYSIARTLEKMKSIDVLVLETDGAKGDILREIAMLLIKNTKEFQQRVTRYKESGMEFYPAQAKAIGDEIEDGEQLMMRWHNIFAVEMLTALKYMYSTIKIVFTKRRSIGTNQTYIGAGYSDFLRYQLYLADEERLADIYGGNDILTRVLLEERSQFENFKQFAALISKKGFDEYEVRKYFIHLLLGITKSAVSIWRMYDFAPYCRIQASENRQEIEKLKQRSTVALLEYGHEDEALFLGLDRSVRKLYEFEERAADIWKLQRDGCQ